ncbi:MAG: gamma-glutamyl-gamma-aminobutyrate hydrolase family protein [Planctomycetota bacterium]
MTAPVVGISADLIEHNGLVRAAAPETYSRAVRLAGGIPVILPPVPETALDAVQLCDALVLTGGDDPCTEPFGEATDPRVTRVDPTRQRAESAVLDYLGQHQPDTPVLGVCLGMQMMALHAGGQLDQFMADTTTTHADHWDRNHAITAADAVFVSNGVVHSKHKQAVAGPGRMRVAAVAHDGVCEAIVDTDRAFYVGVQWHPERTESEPLGLDVFRQLIRSARRGR